GARARAGSWTGSSGGPGPGILASAIRNSSTAPSGLASPPNAARGGGSPLRPPRRARRRFIPRTRAADVAEPGRSRRPDDPAGGEAAAGVVYDLRTKKPRGGFLHPPGSGSLTGRP